MKTPDKCWKWGAFFVNRDDPALFVRKRYGIGYTLNFGNPWSWAVLAVMLLAIAVPLSFPVVAIYALRHRLVRPSS